MIFLALAVIAFVATLILSGLLWSYEPDGACVLLFAGMCCTMMLALFAIPL